jgi:hypothetical protein
MSIRWAGVHGLPMVGRLPSGNTVHFARLLAFR